MAMMWLRFLCFALVAGCLGLSQPNNTADTEYVQLDDLIEPEHPLWEGSLFTYDDRDKAILRGIKFLETQATNDTHFLTHARDYMLGMKLIAQSSHNRLIVTAATRVGREMSQRWANAHKDTEPSKLDKDELRMLTGDLFNGKRYGVDISNLLDKVKTELGQRKFSEFFSFNPLVSPPKDVRDPKTGRVTSKWEGFQNALIFAYVLKELEVRTLEGDGVTMFAAVLRSLAKLKPHTHVLDTANFIPNLSAVLQLVYTLSDYEFLSLDRTALGDEYGLLEQSLPIAIDYFQSVEAVGELVDCLKTFGDRETNPNIQRGVTYLLAEQNADGSWGGEQEKVLGIEHHTTIVAMWGLRERVDHGKGPKDTKVQEVLAEMKKDPSQLSQEVHTAQYANNLAQMLRMMGMPIAFPAGGLPGAPPIPGMPGIPGMPHNPFAAFHTQFGGDGNVPTFELNEAQKQYMQMMTQQQEAMLKQQQAMQQVMQDYNQKLQEQYTRYQQQQQAAGDAPPPQQAQQPFPQGVPPMMGAYPGAGFMPGMGIPPMGLGMPGIPPGMGMGMPGMPGFHPYFHTNNVGGYPQFPQFPQFPQQPQQPGSPQQQEQQQQQQQPAGENRDQANGAAQ